MRTSELEGVYLDLAVAICEGLKEENYSEFLAHWQSSVGYRWSSSWIQGGCLIERERIQITPGWPGDEHKWVAIKYDHIFDKNKDAFQGGDTPLIAVMRCYVASKLGDKIDIKCKIL